MTDVIRDMLGNYLLGTDYKYATLEANGDVYIWKVRPEYNRSKGEWDAEDPDARQVDEVDFSRLLVEHPGPINLGYF